MDLHRSGPPIVLWITLAAALASCSFDRPLPTHPDVLDIGTGFDGVLRLAGDCVFVDSIDDIDPVNLHVTWPAGYRWRGPPLEIVDESGAMIAREGDLISFGIADRQRGTPGGCPAGDTARATEIASVNGVARPHPPLPRPTYRPITR